MTPKNAAAVALGRRGGKARVANQTPEQRAESARRAAAARWAEHKKLMQETGENLQQLQHTNARIKEGVSDLKKLNQANRKKKAAQK